MEKLVDKTVELTVTETKNPLALGGFNRIGLAITIGVVSLIVIKKAVKTLKIRKDLKHAEDNYDDVDVPEEATE